ncbi:MAG: RagB/SusD family nutrient uptake outer membrane protein [Prevotella sp.]|nr:RagB/SusD family nutrient uptake outer membrane protein [Prevotella sp.]
MKRNKNILHIVLLAIVGMLTITSCSDFLEEEPKSMIGPDNVEDSNAGVDYWVSGVYSNWLDDMFRWAEFPRVLELDADYISGPDWLFSYLGAGNFQEESSLDKMWKGPYNLINDANIAKRYINSMKNPSEEYKNNAIGECLFQEAFAYFLLVRAYGPIPVLDEDVTVTGKFDNPRLPVKDVYAAIISRLERAVELLYDRSNPNYRAGHVSAGSAAGLLAKVYATMASAAMPAGTEVVVRTGEPYRKAKNQNGDDIYIYVDPTEHSFNKQAVAGYEDIDPYEMYKKASEWAKKVIDGKYGAYELALYDNLWKYENRTQSEMMWGIESTASDDTYRTSVHTFYSGYKATAGSEFLNSGGWVGCTNNWYKLFDEDDLRIVKGVRHFWRYYYQESYNGIFYYPQSWCVRLTGFDIDGTYVGDPEPEFANTGLTYQYNTSSECLAFTTKYNDVKNDAIEYPESYWPFLRYADVLLIYAEAQNELGNSDEAMKYLNMVRARSNAKLMTTAFQKVGMRSAIIEERAKEFACEGDRRWDLIRWGIYLDAMNAIGGRDDSNVNKARTERNLLYPIPRDEINVNTAIETNNPGWN